MIRHRSLLQAAGLIVVASVPAWSQQNANAADKGPCATPDSVVFRGNQRISEQMLRGDAGI